MTDPVAHIPPFDPETLGDIAGQIINEIERQDTLARQGKFGGTHILPGGPDPERMVVLTEEAFEAMLLTALERLNQSLNDGIGPNGYQRTDGLFDELIQLASCAGGWAAAILEGRE